MVFQFALLRGSNSSWEVVTTRHAEAEELQRTALDEHTRTIPVAGRGLAASWQLAVPNF
jgi:hypothetical protein